MRLPIFAPKARYTQLISSRFLPRSGATWAKVKTDHEEDIRSATATPLHRTPIPRLQLLPRTGFVEWDSEHCRSQCPRAGFTLQESRVGSCRASLRHTFPRSPPGISLLMSQCLSRPSWDRSLLPALNFPITSLFTRITAARLKKGPKPTLATRMKMYHP